jgi:predicted transcriptional regulator
MARATPPSLSRRERQIMDILYKKGSATAAEILEELPDPPSYSSVRALLRILEDKGHVRHQQDGQRYVFRPAKPRDEARRSALRHLLQTFFDNSAEQAVAALLEVSKSKLDADELDRLARLIEEAKKEGR